MSEDYLVREGLSDIVFTNHELEALNDQNVKNCTDANPETICNPGYRLDLLSFNVSNKDEFSEKLNLENIIINRLTWQYFQIPNHHGDIYFQIKYNNSCGLHIEVVPKDRSISINQAIASLIPDSNYCITESLTPITNFLW